LQIANALNIVPLHMFIRFRETKSRLQASLVETRRVDGKVRHEHIAQLGSVPVPPSIADRIAFWKRLHERLPKLSNRIDAEAQAKILGNIYARIPMVTLDEMQQLKIENAEAEERVWSSIHAVHEEQVGGQKELMAEAERAIAGGSELMTKPAAQIADAKDRAERLRKGEDVPGGLAKPFTLEDFFKAGFTKEELRRCDQMRDVCEALGFEAVVKLLIAERDRAELRALRALHRAVVGDGANATAAGGDARSSRPAADKGESESAHG
jgi:hypothetical protein